MQAHFIFAAIGFFCASSFAQTCSGTMYLNPQTIRGESAGAANASTGTLVEMLKGGGDKLLPVVSFKRTEDFVAASKRPNPPCAVYGNPVVGFAMGDDYVASAVNHDSITPAVVFLYGTHDKTDAAPELISSLPGKEAEAVLAALKRSACFGMAGGVTTALIYAASVCGEVVGLVPSEGRGQSYLPSHAAFAWSTQKPVGFITRDSSGARVTMKDRVGADPALHQARMILIPAGKGMLGYGLYLHKSIAGTAVELKLQASLSSLKPDKAQQVALDTDGSPNFRAVSPQDRETVSKSLEAYLTQQVKRGR